LPQPLKVQSRFRVQLTSTTGRSKLQTLCNNKSWSTNRLDVKGEHFVPLFFLKGEVLCLGKNLIIKTSVLDLKLQCTL
jgi:hypothetical protein